MRVVGMFEFSHRRSFSRPPPGPSAPFSARAIRLSLLLRSATSIDEYQGPCERRSAMHDLLNCQPFETSRVFNLVPT